MEKITIEIILIRQEHEGKFYFCIRKSCYRHEGSQYSRDVYNRTVNFEFKETITTIQGQSFKKSRHKDWLKIKGRKQAKIRSAAYYGMGRREAKPPINLRKNHIMMMFNEAIIHLLNLFDIAGILLVFII